MPFTEKLKHIKLLRKLIYVIIGIITYPIIAIFNKLKIEGTEYVASLPKKNVLFVSTHQTYFADVMVFIHIFCAIKWRKKNRLGIPFYLLNPFTRVYFVAAEETMRTNWLTRLFILAGALTVKRTWRYESTEIRRNLDPSDTRKIQMALEKNWVITFPQGTTKPFAPGRKGTAHIIKNSKPIDVPVVINGFWRAFNKKCLKMKKRGVQLSITFKPPLVINYEDSVDDILGQVMDAIEQSKKYMLKGAHHRNS
jgi:1-acyl-sn-glycerol-3-phosphate acyltransferase